MNNISKEIVENLEDSKAKDIINIDLKNKSDMCENIIIANGTSNRHAISIAEKLIQFLKHDKKEHYRVEGTDEGKWVLIDTNSTIIHIFTPETREYYNLEELWAER